MYKAVNISVYCTRWKGTQCESKSAEYSLNTKHHYRGWKGTQRESKSTASIPNTTIVKRQHYTKKSYSCSTYLIT